MKRGSLLRKSFRCQIASLQFLATLFGLGICSNSYGQVKWGIRLNQNSDFFSVTYKKSNTNSYKDSKTRFDRISVAVLYNRKYAHELELFIPQVNGLKPTFPWPYGVRFSENKYSSYSFRYAISRNVYSPTKWFSLSLGGGLNGYFLKADNVPRAGISFPVSDNMIGVSLNAIPGVNVHASKHVSFVLDCSLKVFDFYHETVNTSNPAIPVRQQKERSFETDFFMNAFTFRLGVAYKFGE